MQCSELVFYRPSLRSHPSHYFHRAASMNVDHSILPVRFIQIYFRYINCTYDNGELVQQNLECPGDLVYAEEYGKCVDYNMATECKVFKVTDRE